MHFDQIFFLSDLQAGKVPKFSDIYLPYCEHSKIQTEWFYHGVIPLNDANGIANSEDPDQTAPLGAV